MDLFVLDTSGNQELLEKSANNSKTASIADKPSTFVENLLDEDDDEAEGDTQLPPERQELLGFLRGALASYSKENGAKKCGAEKYGFDDFAESMGWPQGVFKGDHKANKTASYSQIPIVDDDFLRPNLEELKRNNVLTGIEKKNSIERPSARQLEKMNRAEREKTKGKNWFNMPAPEMTEELENDLKILQMRSVLDPKQFYKRNTLKVLPKYFQMGTVQHSPLDYFSERGERKNKKRSLVDELLADAEFQKFNKRKYKEVMAKRQKTGYHKANKKMKKLKKKKK